MESSKGVGKRGRLECCCAVQFKSTGQQRRAGLEAVEDDARTRALYGVDVVY